MDKDEVVKQFCLLSGQVASGVFHWGHAADCFCGQSDRAPGWSYQYEEHVLNYIREAVHAKMKAEGHDIPTMLS